MRKIVVIILLAMIISLSFKTSANIPTVNTQVSNKHFDNIAPSEEIYYDLFITTLFPHVEKAISDYYSEYMTQLPREDPYSYKVISVEKEHEISYSYRLVLEVQPYIGPHISVGRDRITFLIQLDGVTIDDFEHIESYELPPNYQDIIKKKFPDS